MPVRVLATAFLAFTGIFAARDGSNPRAKVEEIANQYLQALAAGEMQKASSLCAPQFFRLRNRDDWVTTAARFISDDGGLKSYELQKAWISRGRESLLTWRLSYFVAYGHRTRSQNIDVSEMPGSGQWRITADSVLAPSPP